MRCALQTLLALLAIGCAPDLGVAPVLCNAEGECPGGYRCVESSSDNVCVREGHILDEDGYPLAGPDAGSGGDATSDGSAELGARPDDGASARDTPPLPRDTHSKELLPLLDGAPVKPAPGCLDEPSEPNNSRAAATLLAGTGIVSALEICYPNDVDLYEITLGVGEQLSVQVRFSHAKGDIEAALLGPDGLLLAEGRSETDDEDFTLIGAAVAGQYLVAVWGFSGAMNTYDLQVK